MTKPQLKHDLMLKVYEKAQEIQLQKIKQRKKKPLLKLLALIGVPWVV
jgi:hypothetical protein